MAFLAVLFLNIVLSSIAALLKPKPKYDAPKPSALSDFQAPTAEEGLNIPVVSGTVKVENPNVVWYGDLRNVPIVDEVVIGRKYGLFGPKKKEKITVGYKYYMGMQLVLSMGAIDSLLEIWVGDKLAWSGDLACPENGDKASILIDNPLLFGSKEEGGVQGQIDVYFGTDTQRPNDYLAEKLGEAVPAWRGICYVVLRGVYIGNSTSLRNWSFVMRRFPRELGGGRHDIQGDANPAEMIYELATNPVWSIGMPPDFLDAENLRQMAEALAGEEFGLSMQYSQQSTAKEYLYDILRHIDAVMYQDYSVGKLRFKLIRHEEVTPDTIVLDPSNTNNVELVQSGWSETSNNIKIRYVDRSKGFKQGIAPFHDAANIAIRNGEIEEEVMDYLGLSRLDLAQRVAMRSLRVLSLPLAKVRLETNRIGTQLLPGSIFVLNWPPLGITNRVFRCTVPNYGTIESGTVEIEAIEDAFGLESGFYLPPDGAENYYKPPAQIPVQRLIELPYQVAEGEERFVAALAVNPGDAFGYQIWNDDGDGFSQSGVGDLFTPAGILTTSYPQATDAVDETGMDLESLQGMDYLRSVTNDAMMSGVNLLLVGDEIMAWQTIEKLDERRYRIRGIVRGVMDTVPLNHESGALAWFISAGTGLVTPEALASDRMIIAKLLPFNMNGVAALDGAEASSLTTRSRAFRPYPPGRVRINGQRYPEVVTGDAAITWAHRYRDQAEIVTQDAESTGDPEGTYTVRVYSGNQLKRTISGLTGTAFEYTAAERLADETDGLNPVKVEITTVAAAGESYLPQTMTFDMAGYGMTYGRYYGGA
ncbi:putative tail protein [Hydrogenispora ethanolica]|uniref:Putative tail protein n=1 Tax=Hydrogenispora ethanolica TaxID=1082276 RepID=A0A4R1S4V4_HYDET|nr:phage tail protein [Hydrogenispora ethanolica]TCL74251.1 putative tail protein [Hydrogenispora ethanolica]